MTRYVMGLHCIDELVRHSPERIKKIYATKSVLQKDISKVLDKANIPIVLKDKNALTKLVESESHQSIVAEIEPMNSYNLKDFLFKLRDKENACLLLLDNICDPQNLGAIFRAADCFKADALIWSKNRGADITPVVSKVSSGASEIVPSIKISNLAQTIPMLQDEGFEVLATAINKNAVNLFDHTFQGKTAIVLGSEGRGIQPLILKKCDKMIYIPMFGEIDSLNVSQATAVILSHLAKDTLYQ